MQVYTDRMLPTQWIVHDDEDKWWIVPGETGGWDRRTPYVASPAMRKNRLTVAKNLYAMGTGIPGIETRSIFGARLQKVRLERQLSPADLADLAGTTRTYVHDLEAGRRAPSLDLAGRLADALKVSVDDLRGQH